MGLAWDTSIDQLDVPPKNLYVSCAPSNGSTWISTENLHDESRYFQPSLSF